jgi:hypothetical protein
VVKVDVDSVNHNHDGQRLVQEHLSVPCEDAKMQDGSAQMRESLCLRDAAELVDSLPQVVLMSWIHEGMRRLKSVTMG